MLDNSERLKQNLLDAGCSIDIIKEFFEVNGDNCDSKRLRILKMHRRTLLNMLHVVQRKIDCLDYLTAKIERKVK